jgi:hypothetical protein
MAKAMKYSNVGTMKLAPVLLCQEPEWVSFVPTLLSFVQSKFCMLQASFFLLKAFSGLNLNYCFLFHFLLVCVCACCSMLCPSSCAGRGVCIYNAERPVCECFDQNETSPSCQTYEIDYTKVFTPPLTPMLNPNNERAGLNLEFDNGEDFTAADQMSEAPTSSAFTRSTIRRGPSATSAVLIGLAILLAM